VENDLEWKSFLEYVESVFIETSKMRYQEYGWKTGISFEDFMDLEFENIRD